MTNDSPAKYATVVGTVIAIAGVVFGLWMQLAVDLDGYSQTTRLEFAMEALPGIGLGVVIIVLAQILRALAPRASESTPPTSH